MALSLTRDADRPTMPTAEAQARAEHQFARLQILLDDWDDVIGEWLEEHIGAERAQLWGIPDTSSNVLADLSRQLSTPGLYGKRPDIHNQAPAEGLVGPGGLLERAGWFSRMPFAQYLILGLSDLFLAVERSRRGGLVVRIVFPHDVYLVPDPDDPSRARAHWELRRRWDPEFGRWAYVWDVWDLGRVGANGAELEAPSFRIVNPKNEDVTHLYMDDPAAVSGDRYPWRTIDGAPVIPRIHYQDADAGLLWNTTLKRGAHRGTLNSALYWTYAGHCARDATGAYVIVAGLDAGATALIFDTPGSTNPIDGSPPTRSKLIGPGSMEFFSAIEGQTPFVHEVGPGANLGDVRVFADQYEMKQAVRWGLNPSDLSRTAANPASAASLMVSNEGKRDFSAQVEPVFRRHDLELIQLAAIVARDAGLGMYPESGYSIQYRQIPRTPIEESEFRDELDWRRERGLLSTIDVYRAKNPGTTEADAVAALLKVAADEARLEAEIGTETDETEDPDDG